MNSGFQSIIEAGVQHAKARKAVIWADRFAKRIVSSTPLTVHEADISEQIVQEAVRAGVAIEFASGEAAAVPGG